MSIEQIVEYCNLGRMIMGVLPFMLAPSEREHVPYSRQEGPATRRMRAPVKIPQRTSRPAYFLTLTFLALDQAL